MMHFGDGDKLKVETIHRAIPGLSLCIAILVYLGTGLGTSLFLGRGHSAILRPHPLG